MGEVEREGQRTCQAKGSLFRLRSANRRARRRHFPLALERPRRENRRFLNGDVMMDDGP